MVVSRNTLRRKLPLLFNNDGRRGHGERGVEQGDGSVANRPTKQLARVTELPGRKDPEFMTDTGLAKKSQFRAFHEMFHKNPEEFFDGGGNDNPLQDSCLDNLMD